MKNTPCRRRQTRAAQAGWFCLFITLALSPSLRAQPASFKVNDRVQTNANGLGWIKGTVIGIGNGSESGKFDITREGKTRSIRFTRTTLCTNSTE